MTFVGISALGLGSVLLWAALTGENPVDAARALLTGTPRTATFRPADPGAPNPFVGPELPAPDADIAPRRWFV